MTPPVAQAPTRDTSREEAHATLMQAWAEYLATLTPAERIARLAH